MICESCLGTGAIPPAHCPECGGSGVTSCCDPARGLLYASPAGIVSIAEAAYHNDRFPARGCDFCGKTYNGPAVYCSLSCALADA
jgi:hypothetical protein